MAVPPRWLHCPRRGNLVANMFLPFKTPLSDQYDNDVPDECRFKPEMLFLYLKTLKVKMGLVIDLTNTGRFYSPDEFAANDIKHQKIPCKGRDECPHPDAVKVFTNFCQRYTLTNPGKLIGVHCTHGYNRTGFLICAYLVEKLDWSVEAAYQAFAMARPPGIIKEGYIKELYNRYASDGEELPPTPALPAWHTESQDDQDGDYGSVEPSDDSSRSNKTIQRKTFIDDMTIDDVVQEMNARISTEVQQMVKRMCKGRHNGFCGAQPVSMTQENLKFLWEKAYMVSWKADGTRFLMLIDGNNRVYMLDRDNVVFHVRNLSFPHKKNPAQSVKKTLVDGELIIDEVNGQKIPRFLIYDIVKYEDQPVGDCDFHRRMKCIKLELIEPRNEQARIGNLDKTREPFSVRRKEFWDISCAHELLDTKFSQQVSHEVDGLIFQPASCVAPIDTYKHGRNSDMLKWKPSHMNSVDFRLQITKHSGEGLLPTLKGELWVGQMNQPFAVMKVNKKLKEYHNKIIECKYSAKGGWQMMRERTDKSFPNSHNTAMGVCNSIRHPVTKEMLFDMIKKVTARKQAAQQQAASAQSGAGSSRNPRKRTHDQALMPPPNQLPNRKNYP